MMLGMRLASHIAPDQGPDRFGWVDMGSMRGPPPLAGALQCGRENPGRDGGIGHLSLCLD